MKTQPLILLFAVIALVMSGCSRNVSVIEGDWTLSSMQGSMVTVNSNYSTLYNFNSSTGILQQINITPTGTDTSYYTSTFGWNIKTDGSYVDSESYARSGQPVYSSTFSDTWTYSPGDPGGGTLTLNGVLQTSFGQSLLLSLFEYNPQFKVTFLDTHNMQLTNNWSYSRTSPNVSSITNNFVLNFKK